MNVCLCLGVSIVKNIVRDSRAWISPYESNHVSPLFVKRDACLQSIKHQHKWAVQRTRRGSIHPSPLETRLFHPPLYIIRRLIRWLVIKLILRLVKLMHRYHRALITHDTLPRRGCTRLYMHTCKYTQRMHVCVRARKCVVPLLRIRGCEGAASPRTPFTLCVAHACTSLFINIVT